MDTKITIMDTAENALNKQLEAPALDPVILTIANEYLAGRDIIAIAEEFNVDPDKVSNIIERKEVKSYIDAVFLSQGYLNRVKRMGLINDVIEHLIVQAMESDVYTKKDLLDWLKHLHEVEVSVKPKDNKPQVAVQVNNYDRLMEDLRSG